MARCRCIVIFAVAIVLIADLETHATTKALSQIGTPDLRPEDDLSLSLQIPAERLS